MNYDLVQLFWQAQSCKAQHLLGGNKTKGALVERLAGVSTLFSPRYKGCDFVVGEGMLKEKHTPEEKPDSVSGQDPPQPQGPALGFEHWGFLQPNFRAWRQSSSQLVARNSLAYVTLNKEQPEMGTIGTLTNEGQDGLPSSETLLHHPRIPGPGCRGPARYMGYGY